MTAMSPANTRILHLLEVCREAAVRMGDDDTVEECTRIQAEFDEADWLPNKAEHEAAVAVAVAKALTVVEALLSVVTA